MRSRNPQQTNTTLRRRVELSRPRSARLRAARVRSESSSTRAQVLEVVLPSSDYRTAEMNQSLLAATLQLCLRGCSFCLY